MKKVIATLLAAAAALLFAPQVACADSAIPVFSATDSDGWQKLKGFSLGADIDVLGPVTVTALGVYDDMYDGLLSNHKVSIWDRRTEAEILSITILAGTGYLLDGYRYYDLSAPIMLSPGMQIAIVAGYDFDNLDDDANTHGWNPGRDSPPIFNGMGHLANVGISRYKKNDPFGYPNVPDTVNSPGPANRYHAGSFRYTPNPEPGTMALLGAAGLAALLRRRRTLKSA